MYHGPKKGKPCLSKGEEEEVGLFFSSAKKCSDICCRIYFFLADDAGLENFPTRPTREKDHSWTETYEEPRYEKKFLKNNKMFLKRARTKSPKVSPVGPKASLEES
jgi:hypothetical protein